MYLSGRKSPQDVYETAKKLLVQAGSMQNNNVCFD